MEQDNYVVGRGRLFFGQFLAGTKTPTGQLYFGNTPELSLSQDEDTLDHYSSEGGIRVKDASVTLQNDSSGSFSCDNIAMSNLALWFRGEAISRVEAGSAKATGSYTFATAVPADGDTVTINGIEITFVATNPVGNQILIAATIGDQATALAGFINEMSAVLGVTAVAVASAVNLTAVDAGTVSNTITTVATFATPANITVSGATLTGGADVTETLSNVNKGKWYQLGVGSATPQGLRDVAGVTITGVAAASYTVEAATGRLYIDPEADDIFDGDDLEVSYGVNSLTESIVIAKGEDILGELQFLANNAHGKNDDYYWPSVRIMPDGDLPLKGDEWMTMTFSFEVLKRDAVTERQYITRRN